MKKDNLGDRIKRYQQVFDYSFTDKTPIIIRLDGKSFHSWTKKSKCEKPFDNDFSELMANTTKFLCQNVPGCVFGYTQSDQISLCIIYYQNNESQPWFDNRIQKIVSVVSSLATCFFNSNNHMQNIIPAIFDCRAFTIPQKQVINYFIWRQRDAIRNSISMLSHAFFSNKQLNKKNSAQQLQMLKQIYINWQDYPSRFKKGVAVLKTDEIGNQNYIIRIPNARKKFTIVDDLELFTYSPNCLIGRVLLQNEINVFNV